MPEKEKTCARLSCVSLFFTDQMSLISVIEPMDDKGARKEIHTPCTYIYIHTNTCSAFYYKLIARHKGASQVLRSNHIELCDVTSEKYTNFYRAIIQVLFFLHGTVPNIREYKYKIHRKKIFPFCEEKKKILFFTVCVFRITIHKS